MEDRQDEHGNTVFPNGFFSEFAEGASTYYDLLMVKGACVGLFDRLGSEDYFNGEFFKITDREREELKTANLSSFADLFVSGKVGGYQFHLWQHYSFEDLPTELISNIYEEFLDKKNVKKTGAVYTPPFLVDLLIDECMPIDEPKEKFKVIDPSCGSGVFLVAAFKRMIVWWRQMNQWQRPGKEHLAALKHLLVENIFGVDKEKSAVQLAMFSLTLALCDELSPKEIWEELKFENLKGKNLFESDFFQLILDDKLPKDFDLVIGNPPFISELSEPAKRVERKIIKETGRPKIPDQQLALLFLEQAPSITKSGGKVCLIIKAGPLLYNKGSIDLRRHIFEQHQVEYIFDFTPLEQVLFGAAKVETAAIFLQNQPPTTDHLFHITFRRTQASREKVYFELDTYDIHKVRYEDALNKRLIWKANLLGGGRLHYLLDRVENIRTLGAFLKEKVERAEDPWYVGEGFIVGNKKHIQKLKWLESKKNLDKEESEELKILSKKYPKADYLTGRPTFPTEAFTELGIEEKSIAPLLEERFIWPRNKRLYEPPHLLIKAHVKEEAIPIEYRNDYLTFRDKIVGIHAPEEEENTLLEIESRLKGNRIYSFWAAVLSSQYLIGRASALLKNDILSLPFPEDESVLEIDEIEQILIEDVLDYHVDFRRNGENSSSVKPTTDKQLLDFAKSYCEVLNSVYGQFKALQPIRVPAFVIYPFYYGDKPKIEIPDDSEIELHLENLLSHQPHQSLQINRILRIYDHNVIYLIKPNLIRYWLRSVAIRDADETFADLVAQGY